MSDGDADRFIVDLQYSIDAQEALRLQRAAGGGGGALGNRRLHNRSHNRRNAPEQIAFGFICNPVEIFVYVIGKHIDPRLQFAAFPTCRNEPFPVRLFVAVALNSVIERLARGVYHLRRDADRSGLEALFIAGLSFCVR